MKKLKEEQEDIKELVIHVENKDIKLVNVKINKREETKLFALIAKKRGIKILSKY